jgi:aminoglycoside 6'-N-acetyltransferase I
MVTVRDYQPGDLDACVALYVRVFGEAPWEEQWDPANARIHLEQDLGTPAALGLVAVDNEQIVGVLLGVEKRAATSVAFMITELYVEGAKQRQGVGAALINELVERLKARDIHTIALLTSWSAPASAFYHKHGFFEMPEARFLRRDLDEEA